MAGIAQGACGPTCCAATSDPSGQLVSKVNAGAHKALMGEHQPRPAQVPQCGKARPATPPPGEGGTLGAEPRVLEAQVAQPFSPSTSFPLPRSRSP